MVGQVVSVQGVSNARPLWERWQGRMFWVGWGLAVALLIYIFASDNSRGWIVLLSLGALITYFAFDFAQKLALPKKKWDIINKVIIPNAPHLFGIKVSRKDFRGAHALNDRIMLFQFNPPRKGTWTFAYDMITGTGDGVYHFTIDSIVQGANESEVTKMVLSDQQRRLKLKQELESRGLYDPALSEEQ